MKLLDVEVVLNIRNKGIQQTRHKPEVMKEFDDAPAPYAILSHRWEEPEVKYEEMIGFTKMEEEERKEVEGRPGYQKIIKSCEQAVEDGHKWLWVDTCCIDKRSSSEQSEAINSMYRWYQNAQVCYVYLNDVESTFPAEQDRIKFPKSNGWPEWFMRGWTLQELIAPKTVKFFNKDWKYIDNKCQLASTLKRITGIPHDVLTSGLAEDRLSVAQIMSWAARRVTTREEDRAYSLMGLFRVNMPMVYGEGKKAFQRLQREIIRVSTDQSIFAWSLQIPRTGSVLAEDPSDFWDCGEVKKMEPSVFVDKLWEYTASRGLSEPSRNKIAGREQHWRKLVAWLRGVDSQEFHTFTVSNVGIQVFLPVVPSRDSPSHCKAILACTRDSDLVTIDLVSSGRSFARTSINFLLPATYPEFKTLHLIHHQDANETRRQVALDDEYASYHGFTRRGTYPREFTDNTVTLSSLVDDLIVIVYANDNVGAWFAIGLGYYLGQEWVHVDGDGRSPTEEKGWEDVDRKAYNRMWKARTTHAMSTFNSKDSDVPPEGHFIKHVHLSQSIWAVRVIWGRWEADNSKIIVDVMQCPGCCVGPCSVTNISRDCSGLGTPGLTEDAVFGPYSLELDGRPVRLWKCSGQRIVLGDYGDYSDGELVRTGNIFEDMRTLGSDRGDSTNWRAVHPVSGPWRPDWMKNQDDLAMAYHSTSEKCLVLRQPQALSLSANEHVSRLLKDLSSRLEEKRLVTTVIQCTDFYTVDDNGKRRDSGDDSAPDNGNYPTEAGMSTLFYIIARPRVWRREPLCKQRQERFKSIRENFLALVDMNQPTGTEPSHSFANIFKKQLATFFSDLFGLKHLKNFIGAINIFASLPSMMETSPVSDVTSVGTAEEDGLRGDRQPTAAESDPRTKPASIWLRKWSRNFTFSSFVRLQRANERLAVEGEIKSISQTLGADLLEHIRSAFCNACREHESSTEATGQVDHMKYDRQLDTPSMLQDIKTLQATFEATNDEGEQRALEEDITGKILWLFWCGICADVDELLPKVVDFIRKEEGVKQYLVEIPWAIASTEPVDDQMHLQRIMYDAGANTSKHQLWLEARAAEQAKWSGTNNGSPTIGDQGATPSTSRQTPSTPEV